MKKIFSVFVLIFCFLLISCNLDYPDKKGSVSFEIPIADLALLRNVDTNDSEEQNQEIWYNILVQIRSDGGYVAAQVKSVSNSEIIQAMKSKTQEKVKIDENNEEDSYYVNTVDFIPQQYLTYSFEELPVEQKYTVMVDVFQEEVWAGEKPCNCNNSCLMFSGETKDIEVSMGKITPVTVIVEEENESYLFDIKAEYLDDNELQSKTLAINNSPDFYICYDINRDVYYFSECAPQYDFESSIYIVDPSNCKQLTNLSFVLKEGSHFDTFNFAVIFYDNDTSSETSVDLADGALSILGNDKIFSNINVEKQIGNINLCFSTFIPYLQIYSISFAEKSSEEEPMVESSDNLEEDPDVGDNPTQTNIDEEIHGSLLSSSSQEGATGSSTDQQLVFNKCGDSNRFIYDVSLKNALNGKTLATGDTVVFVMKVTSPDNKPVTFNQFYYELRTENWAEMNDTALYAGNECINVDNASVPAEGYYTFVMPLNFIQNPQDYNTVLFFFDGQSGTTEPTQTLNVLSLDYYIFPENSKTFVLGLGKNYDSNTSGNYPYRYEFNKPMLNAQGLMCNLEGGETVEISLSGTVKKYSNINNSSAASENVSNKSFSGEIYDGASYSSTKGSSWQDYHPLSNTEGDKASENVTTLTVANGTFNNNGVYKFVNIQTPFFDKVQTYDAGTDSSDPSHNYQFQCTSLCEDSSVLLVIEGFEMTTTVTSASSLSVN